VGLDEARKGLLELFGRRVIGMVSQLLDAVGQAGVGDHQGRSLHGAVESPPPERCSDRGGVRLGAEEFVERLAMFVVERLDRGVEVGIGRSGERAVEQTESLEA